MNERLVDAVRRKATQECGLVLNLEPEQRGTHELFFDESGSKYHSITTLFEINWTGPHEVYLDEQSKEFKWLDPQAADKYKLHSFIKQTLQQV